MATGPVIEEAREKFQAIITERQLGREPVWVTVGTLSAKQAIGSPTRQDFPLLQGKEVMIEADFRGSFGQAFTDQPQSFQGNVQDIQDLNLATNDNRAIFIAAINAVTNHLGMVTGVRHCHDEEPEECAAQIARHMLDNYGRVKVGLVGLQPAILENLVKAFGAVNIRCTDLNPDNTGKNKFGAEIWDGRTETARLIMWCDLLLVTSSTMVNNTFDGIQAETTSQGKRLIIFGVTGAGLSTLLGLERVCFSSH